MKWFKHLSGSLNNSIISEAVERFGGDGYMVFFGILEMVSDEFDIYNPGKLTLRMKKITKNLQLSRQKTVKILRFFDEKAKTNLNKSVSFLVEIDKDMVTINCKRLATLCDNHTQKLLKDTSKPLQSKDEATSSQRSKKKEVRSKKKKDIKEIDHPDWLNKELWKEFKKHRTLIKSPLSEHAEKLCIADLKKLVAEGEDPDACINATIKSGKWKSFYPVKSNDNKSDPIAEAVKIYKQYNEQIMRKYCKQNDIDPEKVMEIING